MTVHWHRLDEHVVPGRRLGRHVHFDERSRDFRVTPAAAKSVLWRRRVGVYDQGSLGSCTGNAMAGALSTLPFLHRFREITAVRIYGQATKIDGLPGTYPPDDSGSSGLAVLKVARVHGWISSYRWCFSIADVLAAIQQGPLITGISWKTAMDEPDSNGLVRYSGDVRGGHEVEIVGYDPHNKQLRFANSWGPSWGDKGYGLISVDDYATALADQGDCGLPIR